MIFFNDNYKFTGKQCASYTRFTRGDDNGNFRGHFIDVSHTNDLLGEGQYLNGKKNGYFEIFYPNGKMMGRGNYVNDVPVGVWDFFYENGLPERTIECKDNEVILLRSVDRKGRLMVDNGNGVFKGIVATQGLMAKGKIKNGRPDGKWISWHPDNGWRYRFSDEFYNEGKYIRGDYLRSFRFRYINSRPYGGKRDSIGRNAFRKAKEQLKTYKQCLNAFFFDNYLSHVEKFRFQPCDTFQLEDQRRNLDIQVFREKLSKRLDEAMMNDDKYKERGYEKGTIIYVTLRFSVNRQGRPENFESVSHLGNQFDSSVASLLSGLTGFFQEKELYFRLKIKFISREKYRFSYRFTPNKLMTW